jgi:hypothetical protein
MLLHGLYVHNFRDTRRLVFLVRRALRLYSPVSLYITLDPSVVLL